MSKFSKYKDLKYVDKKETIQEVIKTARFPIVARVSDHREKQNNSDIQLGRELLIEGVTEEVFADIKVLKYYDNDEAERQLGAEYVLEHETYVGEKFLMPLKFGRMVRYVRRPGSRGRYMTIKEVIADSPAFVRAETRTIARTSDNTRSIPIPAKTVLELKRTYKSDENVIFLECTDGDKVYTFHENANVNFSIIEKNTLYHLSDLLKTSMLPKIIMFQDACPEDISMKENEARSALVTIVNGPIEVLRILKVKYLTCWVRNKTVKSYETVIIPQPLWAKTIIQQRIFPDDVDKQRCISRKYGPCQHSDFVKSSLFVFSLDLRESVSLRSPDFFKQKTSGNSFYDVLPVEYEYSSDEEDSVYSDISEPHPPVPGRKGSGVLTAQTNSQMQGSKTGTEDTKNIPRSLPKIPGDKKQDQIYTALEITKDERLYEKLNIKSDDAPQHVPLGYTDSSNDLKEQYIEIGQVKKILGDNQTEENFFKYSVKEVSFCFEHCGLKKLGELCFQKKFDGSFFKRFDDWNELNISKLDAITVQKIIYEGWRSNDDCDYNISTTM